MTEEEVISLAEEVGCGSYPSSNGVFRPPLNLQKFVSRIRQIERVRCAKVCSELRRANYSGETGDWIDATEDCAKAIEALGD